MEIVHSYLLSLHDAELMSISVDRDSSVLCMSYRLEVGLLCAVELHGVKAFRCEDLTLQNVVSRTLQSSNKDFSSEEIAYWITWATSLSDATSWLNDQRKFDWISACSEGGLELVVFEPSVGAQLAVVCEKVVLNKIGVGVSPNK